MLSDAMQTLAGRDADMTAEATVRDLAKESGILPRSGKAAD